MELVGAELQGLGARDLYSEPLVAKGLVIVTSDSNWIYALRVSDGSLAWQVQVGPPEVPRKSVCGDVQTANQPTIGITSTPVIDETRNEIYAVAAIGTGAGAHTPVRHLFGVDLTTGAVEFDRAVEPQPTPNPYLLQRPGWQRPRTAGSSSASAATTGTAATTTAGSRASPARAPDRSSIAMR